MPAAKVPLAQRAYRVLLRILPGEFRAEFGREMEGVFLDERRDALRATRRGASWRLWLRTLGGLLATAPAQHFDVLTQALRGCPHGEAAACIRPRRYARSRGC